MDIANNHLARPSKQAVEHFTALSRIFDNQLKSRSSKAAFLAQVAIRKTGSKIAKRLLGLFPDEDSFVAVLVVSTGLSVHLVVIVMSMSVRLSSCMIFLDDRKSPSQQGA